MQRAIAIRTRRLAARLVRTAIVQSGMLAIACLLSYELITWLLARAYSVSTGDDLLGGMWAMVATIFVYRFSYEASMAAAVSRMAATLISFALCLLYLVILPFSVWGTALLIGIGALVITLVGRPGDAVTAGITTAVVMVVAALEPHNAWEQPILRLIDTTAGVAVGVAAAWIARSVTSVTRARGRGAAAEAAQGNVVSGSASEAQRSAAYEGSAPATRGG